MLPGSIDGVFGSVESSIGEGSQRNQFDEQIGRIWQALGISKWTDLAKALDKKQASVAGAKQRGRIPQNWLSLLNQKYGLSIKWILTGTGPMKVGDIWTPPDSHVAAPVSKVDVLSATPPVESARHSPGHSPSVSHPNDLQGIRISDALQATARVLESWTSYAVALFLNIQHFDRAIAAESRLNDLEQTSSQQHQQITVLQETIGHLQDQVRMIFKQMEEWGRKPRDSIQPDDHENTS